MPERPDGGKAWILSVDMGYGHQRAAYPFQDIARERILTANNDQVISPKERQYWERARRSYEFLSRLRNSPGPGRWLFNMYDRLQYISPFYPFRDLSKPNFTVLYLQKQIRKGLCKSLVDYIRREPGPILCTHFIPALAADHHGLPRVYCVVTDTDINRVWVPDKPALSNITYLAPSRHAMMRLRQYGVSQERIRRTGFPLPQSLVGVGDNDILKRNLARRIPVLDPQRRFIENYRPLLKARLGKYGFNEEVTRPLTITYMVGGAGAQREIGVQIVRALSKKLKANQVRINLVAGIRLDVMAFFQEQLAALGSPPGVKLIFAPDKFTYFEKIDAALADTDILWTKPSEMTFYAALGLPVVISPPVGAHEIENQHWLEHIGSGIVQEDPAYVNEWLFYILESGKIAEAAWDGYVNAPASGTDTIRDLIFRE
jgi:hypothetical protein